MSYFFTKQESRKHRCLSLYLIQNTNQAKGMDTKTQSIPYKYRLFINKWALNKSSTKNSSNLNGTFTPGVILYISILALTFTILKEQQVTTSKHRKENNTSTNDMRDKNFPKCLLFISISLHQTMCISSIYRMFRMLCVHNTSESNSMTINQGTKQLNVNVTLVLMTVII